MQRSTAHLVIFLLLLIPPTLATAGGCPQNVVISQVYGGGVTGAVYKYDFIELHNPTSAGVSLSGLAIQYASASGSTWSANALPSVSMPGGAYFLIQGAANATGTTDLPSPNMVTTINLGAAAGKVALTSTTAALTGVCPSASIVDLVGYDITATCFEGAGAAPTSTSSSSLKRVDEGCGDTNSNSADFVLTTPPTPRNLASAVKVCTCLPATGCSLDADGNGVVDALTDGLLMLRAMMGLTGPAATSGVIGLNATRTTWTEIRPFLNNNCGTTFGP